MKFYYDIVTHTSIEVDFQYIYDEIKKFRESEGEGCTVEEIQDDFIDSFEDWIIGLYTKDFDIEYNERYADLLIDEWCKFIKQLSDESL